MNRRLLCLVAALTAACLLCGCSVFEQEYVSVHDYRPAAEERTGVSEKGVTIHSFAALKSALLSMAYAGQTRGRIIFDPAYDGDADKNLSEACRAVRTEDALCAYCVQNISYELSKLVSIYEADVTISYSKYSESPQQIEHIGFSSEAEAAILDAMHSGDEKLTLLVARSAFSAEDMTAQVIRTYRDNPTVLPKEPTADVKVFSGEGTQRLYEIRIDYGVSAEFLLQSRRELEEFDPFAAEEFSEMDEVERAYAACRYLLENCTITEEAGYDSAYAALIGRKADSEGAAFGYVELCRRLGVDCRIVYGQLNWREHCWNIIRVEDSYYHVDITSCAVGGPGLGFLRSDESFWGAYRWDVAAYPKCADTRSFFDFFPPALIASAQETDAA